MRLENITDGHGCQTRLQKRPQRHRCGTGASGAFYLNADRILCQYVATAPPINAAASETNIIAPIARSRHRLNSATGFSTPSRRFNTSSICRPNTSCDRSMRSSLSSCSSRFFESAFMSSIRRSSLPSICPIDRSCPDFSPVIPNIFAAPRSGQSRSSIWLLPVLFERAARHHLLSVVLSNPRRRTLHSSGNPPIARQR